MCTRNDFRKCLLTDVNEFEKLFQLTRKMKYRQFLQSEFWKAIAAEKKRLVPRCENCKAAKFLQAHHRFYRKDWFTTELDDLKVLCRKCHRKAHGLVVRGPGFMIYRSDFLFSAIMHRCHCLITRMSRGGQALRNRDESFLVNALRLYPSTDSDTCMKFHVGQVFYWNELSKSGVLKC